MVFLLFILLATLLSPSVAEEFSLDLNLFEEEINQKCLSKLWTNDAGPSDFRPRGLTLEYFIHIVERVEARHLDWDIYDVSWALLKRFAFEGMEFSLVAGDRVGSQSIDYRIRWEMLSRLMGDVGDERKVLSEYDLTDEEKCDMFLMMGHVVNTTSRASLSDADDQEADEIDESQDVSRDERRVVIQEQGVIADWGREKRAISITRVLVAIMANRNVSEHFAHELFGITSSRFPRDLKINSLIGVTLGDIVSLAAIHGDTASDWNILFGPDGYWQTHSANFCPNVFQLSETGSGSTMSLLRGAVDGLLIGSFLYGSMPGASLSRALRTYYSWTGIPAYDAEKTQVSYCRREEVTDFVGQVLIRESVLAFYHVHMYKEFTKVDPKADEKVFQAVQKMTTAISFHHPGRPQGECQFRDAVPTEDSRTICETPSNVFLVQDTATGSAGLVGHLAGKVNFGRSGSLTLLVDRLQKGKLTQVAVNETIPSLASCANSRINVTGLPPKPLIKTDILLALSKTLQKLDTENRFEAGVPSKAVVVFIFSPLGPVNRTMLEYAMDPLINVHRARVLFHGWYGDELSRMGINQDDIVSSSSMTSTTAEIIAQKICKVPALLQNSRCSFQNTTVAEEAEDVYTGYVTNNHVQYWAFHPEYFHKSKTLKIKFQAEGGDIYVCEERGNPNPALDHLRIRKEKCHHTSGNNSGEIIFTYTDPCSGNDVANCLSLNYAILGDTSTEKTLGCPGSDDQCIRLDQVKFTISHEGANCKEPRVSDVVGEVSKATRFCVQELSYHGVDIPMVGQVTQNECQVLCSTVEGATLVNITNGLSCREGTGLCEDGHCILQK